MYGSRCRFDDSSLVEKIRVGIASMCGEWKAKVRNSRHGLAVPNSDSRILSYTVILSSLSICLMATLS